METIIASRQLQVERKHLIVDFCENPRGRFLRICEESHGRRNTVIVPSTGLDEFVRAVNDVAAAGNSPTATA
jgi:orotate phosphoribosyltransferase